MQCWHQYNSANTIVDFVWKMEVCQYNVVKALTSEIFSPPQNFFNNHAVQSQDAEHQIKFQGLQDSSNKSIFVAEQLNTDQENVSLTSDLLSFSTGVICNFFIKIF